MIFLLYFYKRQGNLGLYIGKIFLPTLYATILYVREKWNRIKFFQHPVPLKRLISEGKRKGAAEWLRNSTKNIRRSCLGGAPA